MESLDHCLAFPFSFSNKTKTPSEVKAHRMLTFTQITRSCTQDASQTVINITVDAVSWIN